MTLCSAKVPQHLKTPNDLLPLCPLTSKPTRGVPERERLLILMCLVHLFLSPSGSPEWRLWEAMQHLPQTAHHQNGVSHQSELAWPIKPSASLPRHSLSLSLLLVQVGLCGGLGGLFTNGLSRMCMVAFPWHIGTVQWSEKAVLMLSQEDKVSCCSVFTWEWSQAVS